MESDMPSLRIRAARPEEAEALTALIMRSKAHWGYETPLLDAWRAGLALTPEFIASHYTFCAEDAATNAILGVASLFPPSDGEVYLEHLFVEPVAMGKGVGTTLWRHAVVWAKEQGAQAITLGADPNAKLFYERMGAVVVGWLDADIVPGRRQPEMRYELPKR
jgi:GNAT superfamily N-acetyltransferase